MSVRRVCQVVIAGACVVASLSVLGVVVDGDGDGQGGRAELSAGPVWPVPVPSPVSSGVPLVASPEVSEAASPVPVPVGWLGLSGAERECARGMVVKRRSGVWPSLGVALLCEWIGSERWDVVSDLVAGWFRSGGPFPPGLPEAAEAASGGVRGA